MFLMENELVAKQKNENNIKNKDYPQKVKTVLPTPWYFSKEPLSI